MNRFLSCDWGTSSFRLRLVEIASLKVLAEVKSEQGISTTHRLWQKSRKENAAADRFTFYSNVILKYIYKIEKDLSVDLEGVPLIISGMASSSIGMSNLPYSQLPFHTTGKGIESQYFEQDETLQRPVLLISGVQSEDDVMRGEETQLIGILQDVAEQSSKQLFIFPGTHSKHIEVENRQVTEFRTYMTGEYFELLSKKSILSSSIELQEFADENNIFFKQGVAKALESNLLHASFSVRTNELFGKMNKSDNFYFLSGLIIGTELKGLLNGNAEKIYLCSSSALKPLYESALEELGVRTQIFSGSMVDLAVIKGQLQIYNQLQADE